MNLLPKWRLTGALPSVNDFESATAIEMVAKVYNAMNGLINEYNEFADQINKDVSNFTESGQNEITNFKESVEERIRCKFNDLDASIGKIANDLVNLTNEYLEKVPALPVVHDSDNEKVMQVVDGAWKLVKFVDKTMKYPGMAADAAEVGMMKQRLNNIANLPEGSTTGDAELADIRTAYNGKVYDNAGNAVRGQVTEILSDIATVTENNIAMYIPREDISGSGQWDTRVYEIPNTVIGEKYYLKIGRSEGVVDSVAARLVVYKPDNTQYSYVALSPEEIEQGKVVNIETSEVAPILKLTLCRTQGTTGTTGTATFEDVYVLKKYGERKLTLNCQKEMDELKEDTYSVTENNIAMYIPREDISGSGQWDTRVYEIPNTVIGEKYYLKIGRSEGVVDSVAARLVVYKPDNTQYSYVALSPEEIEQGKVVNIETSEVAPILKLTLCRTQGTTGTTGTATFEDVYVLAGDPEITNKPKTAWTGKKIVWFGTSIPEGMYDANPEENYWNKDSAYPKIVGKKLGASVYNEAVGSSAIHTRTADLITESNPYGYPADFNYSARTFTDSLDMKEWLIDHWNDPYWQRGLYSTMTDSQKEQIRGWSWERKLKKYLTGGSVGSVDLYVFDHGYNDARPSETGHNYEELVDTYGEENLYSFKGGVNFLLRKIYEDNPNAKVIFISHYTKNFNDSTKELYDMQLDVCEDWDIHLVKLCDKLGWSGKKIKTTGYWENGYWIESGGAEQEITLKDANVCDKTHPHTDKSGKANRRIAEVLAAAISNIR